MNNPELGYFITLVRRERGTHPRACACDLKFAYQCTSKTPEERAAAADALAKRETLLQPTYKQIALLYADLHE